MLRDNKDYLSTLDALRFFAAIAVVFFHFGLSSWPIKQYFLPYFKIADLGVSFFFVLSGFILFYVYRDMAINKNNVYNFFLFRFSRIMPLYILSLAFSILYAIIFEPYNFSVKLLLYHLFFLQPWIPSTALTLNFVNWTLSIEVLFYLLFPALVLFINKKPKHFFIFTILFWLISNTITVFLSMRLYSSVILNYEFINFFPIFHLNNFCIGMVCSYLYINKSISKLAIQRLMCLVVPFFLIYPLVLPRFMYLGHHNGLFAPLFGVIIIYVLNVNYFVYNIFRFKPLIIFGKASYGVYLLQAPIYWFTYQAYRKLGIFDLLGGSLRFYISFVILFVSATFSYYSFERRTMVLLRRKFEYTWK